MQRILLRMLQDGSRMLQDGSKDHPGDFSSLWHEGTPGCIQDGSRMLQDGFKDHPGDFASNMA